MAPLASALHVRRLALLALAWCVMTGGVFSGCSGLFRPATPEPPSGKPIVLRYGSVAQTLNTMELGIAAKAQGVEAWLGAFDQATYRQLFDTRDFEDFARDCQCEPPTEWSYTAEQNSYLSLLELRPGDEYVAEFNIMEEKLDPDPTSSTEATVYRHYRIFATSPGSSQIIAIGTADLHFKVVNGNWLITRWIDRRDSSDTATDQFTLGWRRLESTTR